MQQFRQKFKTLLIQDGALNNCGGNITSLLYKNTRSCTTQQANADSLPRRGIPYSEREGKWKTAFASFLNRKSSPPDISRWNPKYFSLQGFKNWLIKKRKENMYFDQRFILQRHQTLGNDLATAHFVVFRGGAVRFVGQSDFIKDDKTKNKDYDDHLPNKYDSSFYLEAVDCSNTKIIYEGLENFKGLMKLKWLSFKDCSHFDDWCLDRISGEFGQTLEYLDISNTKVTEKGICTLYRCEKLKTLKVNGISSSKIFELTCLMLEDINPTLAIEGVNYMSVDKVEVN